MIETENWPLSAELQEGLGLQEPITSLALISSVAATWDRYAVRAQRETEAYISQHIVYRAWKKDRLLLRNAPYFVRYRGTNRTYNDAALRVHSNRGQAKDQRAVVRLDSELASSPSYLPAGQIVFHGTAFDALPSSSLTVNHYFSATFSPLVAMHHALRKAAKVNGTQVQFPRRPTVLIVRVARQTQYLFSPVTRTNSEYEALLSRGSRLSFAGAHHMSRGHFDIVSCETA